jgi:hypothetical protein
VKFLCDYKTLIKRWSCDSKWALTLERQFISDFSLDFVLLLYRFRFFPLDFVFLHYRFRFISLDFVFLIYRFRLFSLYFVFLLYRFRFFSLDFAFLLYRFRWILFSFRFVSFRFFSFLSLPIPRRQKLYFWIFKGTNPDIKNVCCWSTFINIFFKYNKLHSWRTG